jgi:pimeloyl-ACP methyl ester carboxylesterase
MDHPRDLLQLVNHFRAEMPMPIIGIGHSLGGNMLVNLSLIHPRLFHTIVLLDPVIDQHANSTRVPNVAQASTFRRDIWPSRAEAELSFRKQKFYQPWDPRVLDLWCKYGIRDTPTSLFPEEGAATLTTTKHQECTSFLRPSWEAMSEDGKTIVNHELVPDMDPQSAMMFPFYRPESPNTFARLGEIRPSVLYIFGGKSDMSFPAARKQKIETTGVGLGGSGGVKAGRVKEKVLDDIGHLVAMEAGGSEQCAKAAAEWLGQELKRFTREKKAYSEWTKKSLVSKTTLSEEWKKRIGRPFRPPPKGKL